MAHERVVREGSYKVGFLKAEQEIKGNNHICIYLSLYQKNFVKDEFHSKGLRGRIWSVKSGGCFHNLDDVMSLISCILMLLAERLVSSLWYFFILRKDV